MQPEELIGLWDSAPLDFGASESTRLALAPDGTGWTAVSGPPGPPRVRELAWDCPKPDVLELRYADYEFVRARFTVQAETAQAQAAGPAALRLSQPVDTARRFALTRREVSKDDSAADGTPEEAAHGRR